MPPGYLNLPNNGSGANWLQDASDDSYERIKQRERERLTDSDGVYWGPEVVHHHITSDQCDYDGCDLYGFHFHREGEVYFSREEYNELKDIHADMRREAAGRAMSSDYQLPPLNSGELASQAFDRFADAAREAARELGAVSSVPGGYIAPLAGDVPATPTFKLANGTVTFSGTFDKQWIGAVYGLNSSGAQTIHLDGGML